MNPSTTAIFLNLLIYLVFVLVPLIPAIVIYKIFPETTVGASGLLGNLKVNATGAFAAYLVVVVAGTFIIVNIQKLATEYVTDSTTWKVDSKVIFYDKSDNGWTVSDRITDDSVQRKLDVRSNPDYSMKTLNSVVFMTYYKDRQTRVTYSYPGYVSQVKRLDEDSFKIDYANRTIFLGTIELRQVVQAYTNNSVIQANAPSIFQTTPDFK
jgi:hypothetical protein